VKNLIYLSDVYLELKKPDSTVFYANKARQLSKKDEALYYYAGLSMAAGLSDMKRYTDAIAILNKDETGANKMNDMQYSGYSSFLRGSCNLKIKKYPKALTFLNRAYKYAADSKNIILEIQVYKDLEQYYTENNNYESAYQYSKKAYQLSDSIHTLDNEKQISNLNSNFKLEKKQEELKKKQEELIQHRKLLWASAAAIAVFIILSILLYRSDQKRKILNTELAELNNKKDRLFRVMSHDLRSPLADLYHQIDIEQERLPTDYDKSGLNTIQQRLSGTLNMLDNLLYWSIGQIQGLKYTPKPFYICNAFEDAISINKHAILSRNLILVNEVNEDVMAYGDQQMITTVLRNLIQNAIKFSHENGTLILKTTELNAETLQCSIHDYGIGLSKTEIESAFDGGKSKPGTKGEKGTGVGLNLCKTFIEINQGKIYIESEPNAGTTLYIEIPLAN
ncbi:MAG: HAMP domain-containing histidine kinase, partial [Bacteroidetes bacterium]|nr:HAMP domain-containing histidine kinase [Bacteroidota bacterium]